MPRGARHASAITGRRGCRSGRRIHRSVSDRTRRTGRWPSRGRGEPARPGGGGGRGRGPAAVVENRRGDRGGRGGGPAAIVENRRGPGGGGGRGRGPTAVVENRGGPGGGGGGGPGRGRRQAEDQQAEDRQCDDDPRERDAQRTQRRGCLGGAKSCEHRILHDAGLAPRRSGRWDRCRLMSASSVPASAMKSGSNLTREGWGTSKISRGRARCLTRCPICVRTGARDRPRPRRPRWRGGSQSWRPRAVSVTVNGGPAPAAPAS